MIQQRIMYAVEQILQLLYVFRVPDTVWEGMARAASGINTLFDWTPAFPYAPFRALAFTVSTALALYLALFGASMVFRLIRLVRDLRQATI